jgi:hypothetical protein
MDVKDKTQLDPVASFDLLLESPLDAELRLKDQENSKNAFVSALKSIFYEDKEAFFSRYGSSANFIHWLQLKTLTQEQSVALSFGKDPDVVNLNSLNKYELETGLKSQFVKHYRYRLQKMQNDPVLKERETPKRLLEWFKENKILVDDGLKRIADKLKIIDLQEYEWTFDVLDDDVIDETTTSQVIVVEKTGDVGNLFGIEISSEVIDTNSDLIVKVAQKKQKRAHALHEKIIDLFREDKLQSPRDLWERLEGLAGPKEDDLIQEASSWIASVAEILWRSHTGRTRIMKKRNFENFISKLKNHPEKYFHG